MEKKLVVTILAVLVMVWLGPTGKLAAERPEDAGTGNKPDKLKPVPATDVELVKKISLKGAPAWGKGGKGGKPAKKAAAATGQLGEDVDGEKYAVVVGISDYPGTANDLNYGDDDAIDMADALVNVYGFTNVTLLTDVDATRKAILDAIDAIPTDAGEIVFFFSGHGMKGIADDGDKEKVDEAIVAHNGVDALEPIWDGELKGAFAGFTGRIVFVFDSCLAGGMKSDLAGPDRVIAMACTESGFSYEGGTWQNGEFTYYFVDEGILGGLANIHDYDGNDLVGDPYQVTAEEAYDYAKANCTADNPTVLDSFEDDLLP